MPTFYIDPVLGNDTNSGASWATAWRTITSGATAARINSGDEIRIAQSPVISTGVNATFTNGSATVTLASELTKTINHANSTTGWTAAANITLANNTSRKYGSNSLLVTPATAFTTGKVCHAAVAGVGAQDFSAFTKISFFFRPGSATTIPADRYKLCLCSDTAGNTIVNEMNIPATVNNANWHIVVLDNVTALGSSIQSVAIYANSDPGNTAFGINNIVACNNVTHQTLIGWQNDCFYNVQSFDGTTITIDANQNAPGSRGWYGTTGTQALHYINPSTAITTTTFNTINEGGTSAIGSIRFIGGWDTATNTITGYTAFASNIVGVGTNINAQLRNYFQLSNLIIARSATLISLDNSSLYIIDNCVFCGGGGFTFFGYAEIRNSKILNLSATCGMSSGLYYNCTFANFGNSSAVSATLSPKLIRCIFGNNQSSFPNTFTGGTNYPGSALALYKCLLDDTVEVGITSLALNNIIWSYDHDQIAGNHWGFTFRGTINWQTAVKQGSDPGAWRVVISGVERNSAFPVRFQFAQIAVSANAQVTVKAWVKKDTTGLECRIFVEHADFTLAGITAQSATAANNTNWQELTIQFTPTVEGIVPLWFDSWATSPFSNTYIGSITVTQ